MKKSKRTDGKIESEHFTDHARRALAIANQFARERSFAEVDPEHILLAILRLPEGGAAAILNPVKNVEQLRQKVDGLVGIGRAGNNGGKLGLSATSKLLLHQAVSESKRLGHDKAGTEHLLLGLLAMPKGMAMLELATLGLTLEGVRNAVSQLVPPSPLTGGEYLTQAELGQRRRLLKNYRQRLREERLTKTLRRLTADWQEAVLIRSFISELKVKASERGVIIKVGTPLHAWMRWAEGKAEAIDPTARMLESNVTPPLMPDERGS